MKRYLIQTITFLVLLIAVFFIWKTWTDTWPTALPDDTGQKILAIQGQYGDSFGALNALFTGFAFAGVAFTIFLQLSDARVREMESTKEKFEAHFFRLNDSFRSVVNAMVVQRQSSTYTNQGVSQVVMSAVGKDVFTTYVQKMNSIHITGPQAGGTNVERLIKRYNLLYDAAQDDLGPYFRMLYHIIRHVHNSKIIDKKAFTDIVRAEMSSSELCLLAVNCLTEQGLKFKPLVEQYHLLKHMPHGVTAILRSDIEPFYEKSAFV